MRGAIPPCPQFAFMVWRSVKAQRQLYLHFERYKEASKLETILVHKMHAVHM